MNPSTLLAWRVLLAQSAPRAREAGTLELGPISVSQQTVIRVGLVVATLVVAILLLRFVPLLERLVIRIATRAGGTAGSATATAIDAKQRVETLTRVTGGIARAAIWIVALILGAANAGVNVSPLIAGAGIFAVAVGLGAQMIIRDFFSGFFLLLENQFAVGDTVTLAGVTGTVEHLSLRVTQIRDQAGTLHFIPNSSVTVVSNRTHGHGRALVELTFAWSVSETDIRSLFDTVCRELVALPTSAATFPSGLTLDGPVEITTGGSLWRIMGETAAQGAAQARTTVIRLVTSQLHSQGFAVSGALVTKTDPT